jgi:ankyrin repeat protein
MWCRYDEDLEENLFLQALKRTHRKLFAVAAGERWTICIPRAGSVAVHELKKEDFETHLLITNENGHVTSNGKTVTIHDGSVIELFEDVGAPLQPANGLAGPEEDAGPVVVSRKAKILFEEVNYNDDEETFRIVCIDAPLAGAVVASTEVLTNLKTLDGCYNFLWTEGGNANKKARKRVDGLLASFERASSVPHSVPDLVEATRDIYTTAMQVMLRESTHKKQAKSSTLYMDNLKVAMEGFVMNGIFNYFAESSASLLSEADETLNRRTRNLQDVTAKELGLPPVDAAIPAAAEVVCKINSWTTPLEKILCLDEAFKTFVSTATTNAAENGEEAMGPISADEMVPMLALLVIHSEVANWNANLCFMTQAQFSGVVADELSYLLVSLEAAVAHIGSEDFRLMATSRERAHSEVMRDQDTSLPQTPGKSRWSDVSSGSPSTASPSGDKPNGKAAVKELFIAVTNGQIERVKKILGQSAAREREESEAAGCHPLCECEKCSSQSQEPGAATVFARNPDGQTGLHVASNIGHVDIVQLLLERGAKVDALDYNECTPLHLSCDKDNVDCSLILLMHGANVNVTDNDGRTPLHFCAAKGHERCAKVLTWQNPTTIQLNLPDTNGNTPLHLSAKWGFVGLLRELLFYNARRDLKNVKGQTPADCAHSSIIKELLDGPDRMKSPVRVISPATVAIGVEGAVPPQDMASQLLREATEDADEQQREREQDDLLSASSTQVPDMRGRSNAIGESERRHSIATVLPIPNKKKKKTVLSKNELEIAKEREQHLALLFEAVEEGDVELVRFKLFSRGSSKKGEDCHPLCQCDKCTEISRAATVQVDAASATTEGQTALHIAALHGVTDVAKMLIEEGVNPSPWNKRQHTPLHFACQYNHPEVVELLLAAHADMDAADHGGNSPLHFSSANGHAQCAKLMLDATCDVDATNFRGESALHNASRWGYVELVGLLLSRNARIDLVNGRGKTALEECHNTNVIGMLKARDFLLQSGTDVRELALNICSEVIIASMPSKHEKLNGTYRQIGTLLDDQIDRRVPRPVFEKLLSRPPVALYYSVERHAWVVSTKIGTKLPLAIALGDMLHPGLLSGTWSVLGEQGGYVLDLDVEIMNGTSDAAAPTAPINPVSWPHLRGVSFVEPSKQAELVDLQAQTEKKRKSLQTIRKFDGPAPLNSVESSAIQDRSSPLLQLAPSTPTAETHAPAAVTAVAAAAATSSTTITAAPTSSTVVDAGGRSGAATPEEIRVGVADMSPFLMVDQSDATASATATPRHTLGEDASAVRMARTQKVQVEYYLNADDDDEAELASLQAAAAISAAAAEEATAARLAAERDAQDDANTVTPSVAAAVEAAGEKVAMQTAEAELEAEALAMAAAAGVTIHTSPPNSPPDTQHRYSVRQSSSQPSNTMLDWVDAHLQQCTLSESIPSYTALKQTVIELFSDEEWIRNKEQVQLMLTDTQQPVKRTSSHTNKHMLDWVYAHLQQCVKSESIPSYTALKGIIISQFTDDEWIRNKEQVQLMLTAIGMAAHSPVRSESGRSDVTDVATPPVE